ncbi:PAS and ANTAR domain-containing protein [Nocardia arizonensis]|uniref:PAS and ANTAR domain-containing protein n=1 Tax=Nocardia arizonensis TaxID=1141647 RepID=UPI0006D28CCC
MDKSGPRGAHSAEAPVSADGPLVGTFRFWFADQSWEWSDEVALMHGYEPGTTTPTTELLLRHKHPDDRAEVEHALDYARNTAQSFSSRHRIIDTAGRIHHVLVVADRALDESGDVVGTAGYYIDLTATLADTARETLDDTVPELMRARAEIEQAKGVLMRMYRINADQAFRVLQWRSQETNTKLRDLAIRILADLETVAPAPPGVQIEFDHMLLTAHERVGDETTAHRPPGS